MANVRPLSCLFLEKEKKGSMTNIMTNIMRWQDTSTRGVKKADSILHARHAYKMEVTRYTANKQSWGLHTSRANTESFDMALPVELHEQPVNIQLTGSAFHSLGKACIPHAPKCDR
jgi:hypothetical protein